MAAALIWFFVLLIIAVIVLMIVSWCIIFKKAGIHPGKFFIPVYGSYLTYRIAESTGLFVAQIVVSVAGSIISSIITSINSARSYSYYYSDYSGTLTAMLVVLIIEAVFLTVINIIFCIRLARVFGKSGGFAVGLIFLYPVFLCILAFGKAQYYGTASTGYKGVTATSTWKCPDCGAVNPAYKGVCECGTKKP